MSRPTPPPVIYDRASAEARQAQRNLDAEVRFVTEGHHVFFDRGRHACTVRSDSGPWYYVVAAQVVGDRVRFSCTPEADDATVEPVPSGVQRHARQVPLGSVACKHTAGYARRLEREGLVRFDGKVWCPTKKALRLLNDLPSESVSAPTKSA